MRLFQFMRARLGRRIYLAGFFSLLTGVCNTTLIGSFNGVIQHGANLELIGLFLGAIAVYLYATRSFGQIMLVATQGAVREIRADLLTRAMACELARFEQIPHAAIQTAINEDTTELSRSPEILSMVLTSCFTVLTCFIYLCWLSPLAFLLVLLCLLVGGLIYAKVSTRAFQAWEQARTSREDFLQLVEHLLHGFKELKMNAARQHAFLQGDLLRRGQDNYTLEVEGGKQFIGAVMLGGILIYGAIGLFSFTGQSWLGLEAEPFAATILVLLYLTPTFQQVLDLIPLLGQMDIALSRVEALGERLSAAASARPERTAEGAGAPITSTWRQFSLEGISYSYPAAEGVEPFRIGPLDLTLTRGEVVFIIGGNGSGKTTLLKLLVGLYQPQHGSLAIDGQRWQPGELAHRQCFAPLFADFHLFDRHYGAELDEADLLQLLKVLEIDHKVSFRDGAWTTLDLSQGQRKRLGLLQAVLDPAPILVLDEFAADQDPQFRAKFYREILPMLTRRGKTVVAITHDENYFSQADRIVHMSEGQII